MGLLSCAAPGGSTRTQSYLWSLFTRQSYLLDPKCHCQLHVYYNNGCTLIILLIVGIDIQENLSNRTTPNSDHCRLLIALFENQWSTSTIRLQQYSNSLNRPPPSMNHCRFIQRDFTVYTFTTRLVLLTSDSYIHISPRDLEYCKWSKLMNDILSNHRANGTLSITSISHVIIDVVTMLGHVWSMLLHHSTYP